MGNFLSKQRENRIRRLSEQRKNERKRFVLDENTPFNITEAFRKLKASLSVSVPKREKCGIAVTVTSS